MPDEKFNSLDEFEKWIKKWDIPKIWKEFIIRKIQKYKEEFYSEQREKNYNAEIEQKEIE
jgi:predicted ATP-dependent Lon-type protease